MGTALTGLQQGSSYAGLLKTTDNLTVDASLRTVTDGLGADTALQVSTAGIKSTGTLAVDGVTTLNGLASDLPIADGGTAASTANLARVNINKGSVALTDAATIATNAALGNVFTVTLGGNRTLGAPTNLADGATYIWRITQDGGGSRTLAFNSVFKFPGGVDPVLSTAGGSVDIISGVSDSTNVYCVPLLNLS